MKVKKKICLVGNESVGKSSLANRVANNTFSEKYKSTLGVKIFNIDRSVQDHHVKLMIWDVHGGADKYKKFEQYYQGAYAHLIVCDVTNEESIQSLQYYLKLNRSQYLNSKTFIIFNKVDLSYDTKRIKSIMAKDLMNSTIFLTSAKSGQGVNEAFESIAKSIFHNE